MKLNNAVEFLKNIEKDVVIFAHDDGDGICGASILLAYFRERRIRPEVVFGGYDDKALDSFKKHKNKFVIFVDYAIDQYMDVIKALRKSRIMIIDHHVIKNNLNKIGITHVNPRIEKPHYYISASHVAWDICRRAGLTGYSWLSRLGDVCDRAIKGDKIENEAAFIISAIETIDKSRFQSLAEFLSESNGLEYFVYNPKYQRLKERFSMEIRLQLESIQPLLLKDIIFFEVKSRYNISSSLSSMLLDRYPNKTFLLYKKNEGLYHVSGRSKKINLVKAFEKILKGLGRGGGHPVAAGAEIKDIEMFKKRFLDFAKNK